MIVRMKTNKTNVKIILRTRDLETRTTKVELVYEMVTVTSKRLSAIQMSRSTKRDGFSPERWIMHVQGHAAVKRRFIQIDHSMNDHILLLVLIWLYTDVRRSSYIVLLTSGPDPLRPHLES